VGQNPVVGGHNTGMIRRALPKLERMVVRETFENELASYWYRSPEVERGERRPEDIGTEILLLPAALPGKGGTFTNTHRLVPWHDFSRGARRAALPGRNDLPHRDRGSRKNFRPWMPGSLARIEWLPGRMVPRASPHAHDRSIRCER
jgi:hypothetical protein